VAGSDRGHAPVHVRVARARRHLRRRVREGERGLASGLFQTSTHLGGALVLTVLATAASARTDAALETGETGAAALTSGFAAAFLAAAAITALGALSAVRTLPARA
jgi:sugar phosphate permease